MPNSIAVSRAPDSTTSAARAFGVVNAFLERDPTGEIITAVRRFPAKQAQWAEFPGWTHADLVTAYAAKGIRRPYSHQAEAAEAVHAGKNVVIVTPTAATSTAVPACRSSAVARPRPPPMTVPPARCTPVSYTHLDVYKRQAHLPDARRG